MTKTSQVAGYFASFFIVVCFVLLELHHHFAGPSAQNEHMEILSAWFGAVYGLCSSLAALLGAVCLVSGTVAFFQRRRQSGAVGREVLHEDKPAA